MSHKCNVIIVGYVPERPKNDQKVLQVNNCLLKRILQLAVAYYTQLLSKNSEIFHKLHAKAERKAN
jgi:hypothetical protein